MDRKTLYIVDRREPVLKSWMRDVVSFGGLIGCAWFLNTQMPPSGWINFGLMVAWFLWMVGRSAVQQKQMDAAEARAWLDANYPLPPAPEVE